MASSPPKRVLPGHWFWNGSGYGNRATVIEIH